MNSHGPKGHQLSVDFLRFEMVERFQAGAMTRLCDPGRQ